MPAEVDVSHILQLTPKLLYCSLRILQLMLQIHRSQLPSPGRSCIDYIHNGSPGPYISERSCPDSPQSMKSDYIAGMQGPSDDQERSK